jgi:hypothetical protein
MPANQSTASYDKNSWLSIFFPNKFALKDRTAGLVATQLSAGDNPDNTAKKRMDRLRQVRQFTLDLLSVYSYAAFLTDDVVFLPTVISRPQALHYEKIL